MSTADCGVPFPNPRKKSEHGREVIAADQILDVVFVLGHDGSMMHYADRQRFRGTMKMSQRIAQTDERGCFLIRTQYPNGNTYWHGFAEKAHAEVAAQRSHDLDVDSDIYFGVVMMTAAQLSASRSPNGCVLEQEQLSKFIREVQ
jgi:hypothetical protein